MNQTMYGNFTDKERNQIIIHQSNKITWSDGLVYDISIFNEQGFCFQTSSKQWFYIMYDNRGFLRVIAQKGYNELHLI